MDLSLVSADIAWFVRTLRKNNYLAPRFSIGRRDAADFTALEIGAGTYAVLLNAMSGKPVFVRCNDDAPAGVSAARLSQLLQLTPMTFREKRAAKDTVARQKVHSAPAVTVPMRCAYDIVFSIDDVQAQEMRSWPAMIAPLLKPGGLAFLKTKLESPILFEAMRPAFERSGFREQWSVAKWQPPGPSRRGFYRAYFVWASPGIAPDSRGAPLHSSGAYSL